MIRLYEENKEICNPRTKRHEQRDLDFAWTLNIGFWNSAAKWQTIPLAPANSGESSRRVAPPPENEGRQHKRLPDGFVVLGEKDLTHIISEVLTHYRAERPHQGIGNVPVSGIAEQNGKDREVVCREWLGGLLKQFEWWAA